MTTMIAMQHVKELLEIIGRQKVSELTLDEIGELVDARASAREWFGEDGGE